jgi:glutamate-1-semialdehyde 2,1-aminomutase
MRAIFLQETIRRGILASSLVVNYSHRDADIDAAIDAIDGTLAVYRQAIDSDPSRFLIGAAPQPIYRRS